MSEEGEEEQIEEEQEGTPTVRFVLPQRLDHVTFVGRDVVAVGHDIYIAFYNLRTQTENIYVANNEFDGDGVDCIAGHRASVFAFAEKAKNPRIFILSYPAFTILATLKDTEVNRYKSLCMIEGDMVMAFSGFPNYVCTMWSWRSGELLVSMPTCVVRRNQLYMASRTHMLVCECWGEGLTVWELCQCYKKTFLLRRDMDRKDVNESWDVSLPAIVSICWTNDGQLYAIDKNAHLYSIISDGINMLRNLEWSDNTVTGYRTPLMCSAANGILLYCPNGEFKSLKKSDAKWKVSWTYKPTELVIRLISNCTSDLGMYWTEEGYIYKIIADSEEKIKLKLFTYKQRNILKAQLLAPDNKLLVTIDNAGRLCLYDVVTGNLVAIKHIKGYDVSMETSPVQPLVVTYGEVGFNYGMMILKYTEKGLQKGTKMCLTNQIVSRVVFSPTGQHLIAAAMSAGHIFIFKLTKDYKLYLVRYAEFGRGLADCLLQQVGDYMRAFSLVLFSDKYSMGERIICINADNGDDNKFAGKMQGPYCRLLPLKTQDTLLAIPHLSDQYHVFKLTADKGITVSVKMGGIITSGHDLRYFNGFLSFGALLTFGFDGTIIMRQPDGSKSYDLKLVTSHRYESGIKQSLIDNANTYIVSLGNNGTLAVHYLDGRNPEIIEEVRHEILEINFAKLDQFTIIHERDKNYLDLQEDKKVKEEAIECRTLKKEVKETFHIIQKQLVALLEENIAERPLHQLSLSEFNLHLEAKKERLKQAEKEREEIRLQTEARIAAQYKVTKWIRENCWDVMQSPRVKLFAIFSHYQVENYAVLPTQRVNWPELDQIKALRTIEMEKDEDVFRSWEEIETISKTPLKSLAKLPSMLLVEQSIHSQIGIEMSPSEESNHLMNVLCGTNAHLFIDVPAYMIPQTLAYTYLHMNSLQHIVKLNVQNMRLWFNKQFDELMNLKKREVGLVEDRNNRLRFIISELNKLSDLRGSFHHLTIEIRDPEWRQEEQPHRLTKVDPEECSITPYISPSQIVIPPIDPGPKDDFRERALIEMMDGVLEKLWHEEIKKPIPKPQCMLDKDPEHFNEDDLRLVFDYEAKVEFRKQERDKYRKMLHAEYAKLLTFLNEGIVRFNLKVKEMWLTKLRVDSVIGQENLNLMRLRRVNLDRLENAENLERMRNRVHTLEHEIEDLQHTLKIILDESDECQAHSEALALKDKTLDRTFKNHFADLSPIIVDQCYKYFKKRPKWHHRATMTPAVLNELAAAVLTGEKPPLLHPDVHDYFKGVENLDVITNMPAVMDETLWHTMCKLRRIKIDNEIRMRATVQDTAYIDSAVNIYNKAITARRLALQRLHADIVHHREEIELKARNKTIQLVLPAGQVEIITTGHMEDFDDATLILREDIDAINDLILKVGRLKLKMMRKQMEFRKGILAKEWEHAQMKMKLRHMQQELYSYERLKIPKELQLFLKNKELGYTEEREYVRMEKEIEASKMSVKRILSEMIQRCEELQVKMYAITEAESVLEKTIATLNVQVSEKRLLEDPLEPIRVRKTLKHRMETLVKRSRLIRQVQANHSTIVMLQTELELLRLKTYPTLATFQTIC